LRDIVQSSRTPCGGVYFEPAQNKRRGLAFPQRVRQHVSTLHFVVCAHILTSTLILCNMYGNICQLLHALHSVCFCLNGICFWSVWENHFDPCARNQFNSTRFSLQTTLDCTHIFKSWYYYINLVIYCTHPQFSPYCIKVLNKTLDSKHGNI